MKKPILTLCLTTVLSVLTVNSAAQTTEATPTATDPANAAAAVAGLLDTVVPREEKVASDSALIVFEIGSSEIKPELGNNGKQISNIYASLEKAIKEGKVERISIQATASPEGGYEYNRQLSQDRANSIVELLTARYPLPDRKVEAVAGGVAWDLFRQKVENLEDGVLQRGSAPHSR